MTKVLRDYPEASAVFVRRHGLYVWGKSWEQTFLMMEGLRYLCEMANRMTALGMDPSRYQ
jgi:methylthioribulose-1-phosphate dehydratase